MVAEKLQGVRVEITGSEEQVSISIVDGDQRIPLTRVRSFVIDADVAPMVRLEMYVDAVDVALDLPRELGDAIAANERIRMRNAELERRVEQLEYDLAEVLGRRR